MRVLSLSIVLAALTAAAADSGYGNLIDPHVMQKNTDFAAAGAMWHWDKSKFYIHVQDGILTVKAMPGNQSCKAHLSLGMYPTGDAYKIEFEYRSGKAFGLHIELGEMEYNPKRIYGPEVRVQPSKGWKKYSKILKVPLNRHSSTFFIFGPKEGQLEIRNLSVIEQEPADVSGREFMVDGKKCPAIYWCRSSEQDEWNDKEAAQVFRFALRRCGGELLPIREAKTPDDFKQAGFFIGKAAEKAGFKFGKYDRGGYSSATQPGRLGISGHYMGGVYLGVFQALKEMGIQYLSEDNFFFPKSGSYTLNHWDKTVTPALAVRKTESRAGRYLLKGYTPERYVTYQRFVDGGAGHTGAFLLPGKEFAAKHPEYYAVQKDGKRMNPIKTGQFNTHYCLSNPDVIRIFADRLKQAMRCTPGTCIYPIYDGDGYEMYCHCPKCKAIGNTTDLYIHFANEVAKITSKEFPDKYVLTISYVDTFNPPAKVLPVKNVLVELCAYSTIAWGAQNNFQHPYNSIGRQNITDWNRICKNNMFFGAHPVNYREMWNIHPKHRFNNELMRFAAKNKWLAFSNCYYICTYSNGSVPGSNSFFDLGMYLQTQIAIDPSVNEKELAQDFIRKYYGPAAKEIQEYYELIEEEPIRRKWAQGCEEIKRGFITGELAAKCLKLLDAAEKKAGNGPYRKFVLKEKIPFLWSMLTDICRGQANVSAKEAPQYAMRLAEFCKLCKERSVSYMRIEKDWFRECHFLNIKGKKPWFNDPVVQALIKDPVKIIGKSAPNVQKTTPEGIVISAEGFAGGQKSAKCGWMRTILRPAVCLRRASSSFSTSQALLNLAETPNGPVKMTVNGIEDEKKDRTAVMEIMVNGTSIFKGLTPFEKLKWSKKTFTIPSGLLKKGENDIVFRNITKDTEKDGECGAAFVVKRNYFWGWYEFDEVLFEKVR